MIDPGARARLEAAIDAALDTGIRAANYATAEDTEPARTVTTGTLVERTTGLGTHLIGCTTDNCDCPTPRPDPRHVAALHARAQLHTILELDAHGNPDAARAFARLYAEWITPALDQRPIPGHTTAPPGRCIVHWAAGRSIPSAKRRNRCHRCDDFHSTTGHDYPTPVLHAYWSVVASLVAATPDSATKRDRTRARTHAEAHAWDHPRVLRAWDACGWIAQAGNRYPTKRP